MGRLVTRRGTATTVALFAVLFPGMVAASAAGLGGLQTSSFTTTAAGASSGAPTVLIWENFNGATGNLIAGTTTDGGGRTWAQWWSTWRIANNRARPETIDAWGIVGVDSGLVDFSVEATMFRNGTQWGGGVFANGRNDGSRQISAEWTNLNNGSYELWSYNAGSWLMLGSVTNLYPGGPATAPSSIVIRLAAHGNSLVASYDGVPVMTVALTPAQVTTFKAAASRYAGLIVYEDTTSRFDDFHVDLP